MKFFGFYIALIAFLLHGCNTGQEHGYGFNDWNEYDINEDDVMPREEFEQSWEEIGEFKAWDHDGDGYLDEEEWMESHESYYMDWDSEKYGYYEEWDLDEDGKLSAQEVALNTFDVWDMNDNGKVEKSEFKKWHPAEE